MAVHRDNPVSTGLLYVYCVVRPFAVLLPAEIQLLPLGYDRTWMVKIRQLLHIGDVGPFAFTEVTDRGRYAWLAVTCSVVQLSAAVVDLVHVMIGNAFAAEIVERCFQPARYRLRTSGVGCIPKRLALVALWDASFSAGSEQEEQRHGLQDKDLHRCLSGLRIADVVVFRCGLRWVILFDPAQVAFAATPGLGAAWQRK